MPKRSTPDLPAVYHVLLPFARKPIFCESLQMAKPFPLPFHLVGDKSSSDNSSRSLEPFRNELRSELHPVGCPGPGWARGSHN